jgi:hypothetical protein
MPVGQTHRRAFLAALSGAAAWPMVARGQQKPSYEQHPAGLEALSKAGGAIGRPVEPMRPLSEDPTAAHSPASTHDIALSTDGVAAYRVSSPAAVRVTNNTAKSARATLAPSHAIGC